MAVRELVPELVDRSDPSGRLRLRGAQCAACDEIVFPPMLDCPACFRYDSMVPLDLDGAGTLQRAVLTERGGEGFRVPYFQTYVQLDDGPTVYATVSGDDPRSFRLDPGMRMRLVWGIVRKDGDTDVAGWLALPESVDE